MVSRFGFQQTVIGSGAMGEFLRFETMITPVVIQIIFWIGVVVTVIAGFIQLFGGGFAVITGLLTIILGPIAVRIYCEIIIIFFKINDHLRAIQQNTQR
jgi:uncharacterized protein DUF4282